MRLSLRCVAVAPLLLIIGCSAGASVVGTNAVGTGTGSGSGSAVGARSGSGTGTPERSDATTAATPVITQEQFLFIVDTSGAMVVIDPAKNRLQAINQFVESHSGSRTTHIGVIAFNSAVSVAAQLSLDVDLAAVDSALQTADNLCDFEGALGTAASIIHTSAIATDAATRAQTRYRVVFLAGSMPDPICTAEPTPCGTTTCQSGYFCSNKTCSQSYDLCAVPRGAWTALDPPLSQALYPDLVAGMDYNTVSRIDARVLDIVALQTTDQIGAVDLSAVLNFDPRAEANPLAAPFAVNRGESAALLQHMAQLGAGSYIDLNTTPTLPF